MKLEAFGRMLHLRMHFCNENKDNHWVTFKPTSKFSFHNKDAAIELYLHSLKEKRLKIEVPKHKFNNLTSSEQKAFYDLKHDTNIVIMGADKGSAVVAWDRVDYIKWQRNNSGMKKSRKKSLMTQHLFLKQ